MTVNMKKPLSFYFWGIMMYPLMAILVTIMELNRNV